MKTTAFRPQTLQFLQELQSNNNRDWFNANKSRYEEQVLDVALAFIQAMQQPLATVSPHFQAVPKRVGGSLMRVYRDTRFGRDKTPYKTNVGIQFRHEFGKDVHAPGFYIHLDPQRAFLGAGMWRPAAPALKAIRQRIDSHSPEWLRAREDRRFSRRFQLGGDTLTRAPRGFPADHALLDDLKRKDFIAVQELEIRDMLAAGLLKRCVASFDAAAPFMRFLCKAVNVPY